jgi:hypothetical protein
LTLRQYLWLIKRWQEDQARQDRRSAHVVWALAEINRNPETHPEHFSLEDFPLHAWSFVAKPARTEEDSARDLEEDGRRQIALWQAAIGNVWGDESTVIHE